MDVKYAVNKFEEASSLLPRDLALKLHCLPENEKAQAEEIRLRNGRGVFVLISGTERQISGSTIPEDIDRVIETATQASAHSVRESVRHGYITAKGGHRIGICGTAVVKDGSITGFRSISSLAIRVSKEVKGVAGKIVKDIAKNGKIPSTLIISPPGGGKTTLLRDMICTISNAGNRVSLADERGEIAAMHGGKPQMDIGTHTDVLELCPRAEAVIYMLRAMNPDYIAMDEITDPCDLNALMNACGCGVRLMATVHGASKDGLYSRKLYGEMLESGLFERFIVIEKNGGGRRYRVE